MMERIDREGSRATERRVGGAGACRVSRRMGSGRGAWDGAVAALPADWTDVYAQVELESSDFLDRGSPADGSAQSGAVRRRRRLASASAATATARRHR